MYKIEKHYINDHGIKIQYVVIDLCCAKVVAQYDSYENAEGWIIRKLIGDPKTTKQQYQEEYEKMSFARGPHYD